MPGLERLHFFDGQRLQAVDLALEQAYHIRVRRLLNRGLYSPGVVDGLLVTEVDQRHVRVTAGMALDPQGREIVLLEDAVLSVPSRPATAPLPGWFLVIQYGEVAEPGVLADCRCGSGTTPPARIAEVPTLAWTETWPNQQQCGKGGGQPSDCAVVLGLVVLDSACRITKIEPGVRQYAHSVVPGQVHPYALEGEKDIDSLNPKVLHFQIRGGPPNAVLLYLWADAISSLLYTELGSHAHGLSTTAIVPQTDVATHVHHVTTGATGLDEHVVTDGVVPGTQGSGNDPGHDPIVKGAPGHSHPIRVAAEPVGGTADPDQKSSILTFFQYQSFGPNNWSGIPATFGATNAGEPAPPPPATNSYIQMDGVHTHPLAPFDTLPATAGSFNTSETISVTGGIADAGNTAPAASTPYQARDGQPAYSYPDDVHVKLDGTDITALVNSSLGWTKLGDGTAGHQLVTSGTGSIDLIQLGLPLAVGPHRLELRVNSGGGKVLYNLYVE